MKNSFNLGVLLLLKSKIIPAQTARKPSAFEAGNTQSDKPIKTQVAALNRLASKADFERLARVYEQDTDYEIPHVLFLIDRQDHNRIDFINTPKYSLHETYLSQAKKFKPSAEELKSYYYSPKRRFILDTIS